MHEKYLFLAGINTYVVMYVSSYTEAELEIYTID